MNNEYFTLNSSVETEFVEKKSVFIGNGKSINSQAEADEFIQMIRSKYHDARHNVYAYKIDNFEKYSDDGEPQGTAGIPIISIIQKKQINNCIIVVTRYFGGILLGAPGLVRAYTTTAVQTIDKAGIRQVKLHTRYKLTCSYQKYDKLVLILSQIGLSPMNCQYGENIIFNVDVPSDSQEIFKYTIMDTYNLCDKIDEDIKYYK